MAAGIEVDDRSVLDAFNRLLATGENPSPALQVIGQSLVDSTKVRFFESKSPSGAPWARLKPSTLARRRGGSSTPLRDTGRLVNSISSSVGQNYVEVGTNVVYARTQQMGAGMGAFGRTKRGAPIPWGNVPGRPFLGLSSDDRETALDVFRDAILRAGEGR